MNEWLEKTWKSLWKFLAAIIRNNFLDCAKTFGCVELAGEEEENWRESVGKSGGK
jgi:hypothetical protein